MKRFSVARPAFSAALSLLLSACLLSFAGCGSGDAGTSASTGSAVTEQAKQAEQAGQAEEEAGYEKTADAGGAGEAAEEEESGEFDMKMKIGETDVRVVWEDNESVAALRELCADAPLVVECSMYGGFEQVGPLGARLPRNDVPTVTGPGDIVLYSGNQLVVFYGSNSWSYTKLGRVADRTEEELAELLGAGDTTVTVYGEK